MKRLSEEVVHFFHRQNFVIVSSIDRQGWPHSSCKGIVAIQPSGRVFLLDLYHAATHTNLKENSRLSITAVDEHRFEGYCLKGRARVLGNEKLSLALLKAWEERIASRITQRVLRNVRQEGSPSGHAEALLPQPKYLIAMEVEEVIDLTPHHLKERA